MRRLFLLLGLVVLTVGVWMMVLSAGEDAVPSGSPSSDGTSGETSGNVIGVPLADEEERAEVVGTDLEREVVEDVEATTQDRRFLRVLVTNNETGSPVPGATVFWYEYLNPNTLDPVEREHYQRIVSDWEKQTARYGRDLVADDLGSVRIPVQRYVRATSRHGELYGELEIRPDPDIETEEEFRLELQRDLRLRVRVVDSLGEPAVGVRVGIIPMWADGSRDQMPYRVGVSEGPSGLLVRPHLQVRLERWKTEEQPAHYLLRALIPGSTQGGVVFDEENPHADPIILQLPPTGRVVLRATDRQGVTLPAEVVRSVFLGSDNGEERDASEENYVLNLPSDRRWVGQANEDGSAAFEWVVANKSYLASARMGSQTVLKRFAGPSSEDQEIQLALTATEDVYVVTGRVLDDQGELLRRTRLIARYGHSEGSGGSRSLVTDDEGRFTTYMRMSLRGRNSILTQLTVEDVVENGSIPGPVRFYSMVGNRTLLPGENDLGDLTLTSSPLLAAGRILVDGDVPDEQPTSVNIQAIDPASSFRAREVEQLSVRYPGKGRFEVWGVPQSARYRAWVSSIGYLPAEPIEFAPGADDILINLDSGGSLEAVVLLDEDTPTDDLWLRLIPMSGRALREQVAPRLTIRRQYQDRLYAILMRENDETHTFRWDGVWPGGYRFELLFRGARVPTIELRDVHVAGGEENRDPRLEPIDLRGTIRKVVVRVLDEGGSPLSESVARPGVVINNRNPDVQLQGYAVRDGTATIITSERYLDLLVLATGYKPVEVSGISSDTTVTLQPLPKIVLRIEDGMPRLPADHTLSISIYPKAQTQDARVMTYELGADTMDSWLQPSASGPLSDSGEAALPVGEDGVYGVRVSLRNNPIRSSFTVQGIEPAGIDVRAAKSPQIFQIRIPEPMLKQAIEALSRR